MKIKWSKSSSVTEVLDRKCLKKTEFKNVILLILTRTLSSCISARIWFPPHCGRIARRRSIREEHQHDILPTVGWPRIRHCPLASKQHQYPNPCQQHQEFQTGIPSKNYPGKILLDCSSQMTTGVHNLVQAVAIGINTSTFGSFLICFCNTNPPK